MVLGYGAALTTVTAVGSAAATAIDPWPADAQWATVVVLMAVVAGLAAMWTDALGEPAPGAFFIVFTAELACVLTLHHSASAVTITLWTVSGVSTALIVTFVAALTRPRSRRRPLSDAPTSACTQLHATVVNTFYCVAPSMMSRRPAIASPR